MLRQGGSERGTGSLTSLSEVDDIQETLLLYPTDRVTEGDVPGDLGAAWRLPGDLDNRLWNVLKAIG